MARAEARIFANIWSDPDFLALPSEAQRAYMFLLSQPDLTHAGVIPLRVRRWAQKAAGLTAQALGEALRQLERIQFIIADRDTEELLVRSLIRRDEVYRQPNLLRAARKSLPSVASHTIRAALAIELARVLPDCADRAKAEVEGMLEDLTIASPPPPTPDPLPIPTANPLPNPSETHSRGSLGDRGVVTAVTTGAPNPYPLAPEPLPPDPIPLATLAAPPNTHDLVAEWVDNCRTPPSKRTVGAVAKHVKALLDDRQDPEHVRAGLDLWRRKGADPSSLHSFVNQVANAEPRGSPNGRVSPDGLVEVDGHRVKPATAARMRDQARWAAEDAANTRRAIEGPT